MLRLSHDIADRGLRFGLAMHGIIALDAERGLAVIASRGRRRGGRPTRYLVLRCDVARLTMDWDAPVLRLTAHSDAACIEQANARLLTTA